MTHEPDQLVICATCHLTVGPFRDPEGRIVDVVDCACARISQTTRAALPRWDSIRDWERLGRRGRRGMLCHACAGVWVADTSRWSSWFCGRCRPGVVAVNALAGRPVIPLGRHSLVNRVQPAHDVEVTPAVRVAAGHLARRSRRDDGHPDHPILDHLPTDDTDRQLRRHLAAEITRILVAAPTGTLPSGDVLLDDYLAVAPRVTDGPGRSLVRLAASWAGHDTGDIDAPGAPPAWHEIVPGLWMGDARFPPQHRFDVVVTLDEQDAADTPPSRGDHVVIPMVDTRWVPIDQPALRAAVTHVLDALADGHTVLVRCRQGLNRSGLVVGEVLAALGTPRDRIVDQLRTRRDPRVLSNPRFADHVRRGHDG